jgi:glycosyltransferase involved in cell wall biosynthesis/ubiquinone/menaquinone biosynthesis C-methylase UbiE
MTARYLYVAADLAAAGTFETEHLVGTTERHKVRLAPPVLQLAGELTAAAVAQRNVDGVVMQLTAGAPLRSQLRAAGRVLATGKRLWFHWPAEGAVECIDDERLRSLWKHWVSIILFERVVARIERIVAACRRLPAALVWAWRDSFPLRRQEILNSLERLYERAHAAPFSGATWDHRGVSGGGVYLRTDFWNSIASGGSYGHTCYVAKELHESSDGVVCLLPQRYALLDDLRVPQVVMHMPVRFEGEKTIVTASGRYYPIVKAVCEAVRPSFIYERLCLGNWVAAMVSRDLQIPYILEYNGSEISIQRSFARANPFVYADILLKAEALAFRQATAISVVSQAIRDDLIARGVETDKILVNPNGADLESYAPATDPEKADIRRELGFDAHHRVVGFTATFGGWHGVDVLAEALPRVCAASPDIRFLLIGDGAYKRLIDDAIERHPIADRVVAVGRVPQAAGARLLKACDVYVAPHNAHMTDSRFFGSPTKIFEYMAMAGGIVASNLEQIGEVLSPALRVADLRRPDVAVRDERSVLCTPGSVDEFVEAVVALAARPDLCKTLGRNSRQAVADHYSWKKHVEHLWCFARTREASTASTITTADVDKDQTQQQWNNSPVGSERAKQSQPHTREWFREIERDRYETYAPWMPEVMEFASHAGQDVLEIGGGLGIDLAQFASHGARVTDVDLSSGHLALAEEHFQLRGLRGRFVHHDAEDLPFADASFDLVYSNGVIHHTPNTAAVVDQIYRVLRPGGRAIVMVYAEDSLYYWRNLVFDRGLKEGELRHASIAQIMSKSVEASGTDARPLVKVYTRRRLRRLFRRFTHISVDQRQLRPDELPRPLRGMRPMIERVAGWTLIIKATKPAN